MDERRRATARQIAQKHLEAGDPLGWFEYLYSLAGENTSIIPWADLRPNPNLVDWLDQQHIVGPGKALKVGCGLGDDAEELARRGFETTAFDVSETAIAWRVQPTIRRGRPAWLVNQRAMLALRV